jgi:carboxyl-terminal processing protease
MAEPVAFEPVKEANLSGHLENNTKGNGSEGGDGAKSQESLANRDYQLYEALNLLKGLYILKEDK